MATVLDKRRLMWQTTLLVSVFVSGCSALAPVERQANEVGSVDAVEKTPQHRVAPAKDAPLPRQAYNSVGEKVPYVPQANPYTAETAPVPAEAKSIFVLGSGLLQQGKLRGARTQFRKLTEKYPLLSGPWVKLGVIAEKREKYDDAIKQYKKAIAVNKNNVNAYIALALVQRRQGHFSDARNTYVEALEIWRDFPEAHLNLAILYDLYMNKAEEAQKHYEAYYFLTGKKDEKVHKWLVEVKRRTGIEQSFIDIPPREVPAEEQRMPAQRSTPSVPAEPDSAALEINRVVTAHLAGS
jgi:tetratricopeptide (TPR) repeat protein